MHTYLSIYFHVNYIYDSYLLISNISEYIYLYQGQFASFFLSEWSINLSIKVYMNNEGKLFLIVDFVTFCTDLVK